MSKLRAQASGVPGRGHRSQRFFKMGPGCQRVPGAPRDPGEHRRLGPSAAAEDVGSLVRAPPWRHRRGRLAPSLTAVRPWMDLPLLALRKIVHPLTPFLPWPPRRPHEVGSVTRSPEESRTAEPPLQRDEAISAVGQPGGRAVVSSGGTPLPVRMTQRSKHFRAFFDEPGLLGAATGAHRERCPQRASRSVQVVRQKLLESAD